MLPSFNAFLLSFCRVVVVMEHMVDILRGVLTVLCKNSFSSLLL